MKCDSKILDKYKTNLCPDVVEWNPNENKFLCGTYEVLKDQETSNAYDTKRCGNISLLNIVDDKLNLIQQEDTNAIFDIKWKRKGKSEFGAVDAKGNLLIYRYEDDCFTQLSVIEIFDKYLAINIDWNPINCTHCIVTGSDGSIAICDISKKAVSNCWKAHDFECWNAIYDMWDSNIVYSGGDDSAFLKWDIRDTRRPCIRNKGHNAGVCAVSCNPNVEHQLLTGSYDDHLRVWDSRYMSKQALMEINLNGGVWKLKWHPKMKNILAVPCMYGGLKVVELCLTSIMVIDILREVGPLSYGVDWSSDENSSYLTSCFFYEKTIHLHKVSIKS